VKDLVDKKLEQQSDGTNTISTLRLEVRQKALQVGIEVIEVVLKLIIEAIFGNPLSAIVTFVLNFFTDGICQVNLEKKKMCQLEASIWLF